MDEIPFELKLAFEHELYEKFSIEYILGTSDQFKVFNLTFEGGYTPSEKMSLFLEYFSSLYKSKAMHNIDAGVLYGIMPGLQIDLAGGRSLTHADSPYFGTMGIAYFLK